MKKWILAYFLMAGIGLGLFIGIGCAVHSCPFGGHSASGTDGQTLFLANCAGCHGPDGTGRNGPSLVSGEGGSLSGAALFAKISRGRPFFGMPAFKFHLSDAQIQAIASYIETGLRSPSPSQEPSP